MNPTHARCLQVKSLDLDLKSLPMHSLVTSAFVTYLPMLPEEARANVQKDWIRLLGIQVGSWSHYPMEAVQFPPPRGTYSFPD